MPKHSALGLMNVILLVVLVIPGGALARSAPAWRQTSATASNSAIFTDLTVATAPLPATLGLSAFDTLTPTVYFPFVRTNYPPASDMVLIPAGAFQMGCDLNHNGGFECQGGDPLHTVYLGAYRIDRNLVTNAQYAQCVADGTCLAPEKKISYSRSSYYGNSTYANYPVIWVSWDQARVYCAWAGRRLPTEAEWEKAARGSSDTRAYPWGDQTPDCTLANFDASAWYACIGDTTAVGSYPAGASPYGVLDMAGNAAEWVNDWYAESYYSISPASNPPGPATGSRKVQRGGYFWGAEPSLRVADRHSYPPESQSPTVGFRCVATP